MRAFAGISKVFDEKAQRVTQITEALNLPCNLQLVGGQTTVEASAGPKRTLIPGTCAGKLTD